MIATLAGIALSGPSLAAGKPLRRCRAHGPARGPAVPGVRPRVRHRGEVRHDSRRAAHPAA